MYGEAISQEDIDQKFLRILSQEWTMHTIVWRNKPKIKTLSLDDLFNNLKFLLKQSQPSTPHLDNEDLQQIDLDDLEEMNLRWNIDMLTARARRFLRNTGRKLDMNNKERIRFDKSKVECFNAKRKDIFARGIGHLGIRNFRNGEPTRRDCVRIGNQLMVVQVQKYVISASKLSGDVLANVITATIMDSDFILLCSRILKWIQPLGEEEKKDAEDPGKGCFQKQMEDFGLPKGYTQEEGIDYDDVFAPVARIEAVRLFLAYVSFKDFVVYQMDIKSAFLYGNIEEEVYVCQPLGFEHPEFPDRVYKVEKALYGLHQAPKAWYETLSTYLLDNGIQRGHIDKILFIKKVKGIQVTGKLMGFSISQDMSNIMFLRASLDRKSTIGGCQFLGCRLISWQCKKQTMVANSTIKAEYIAASNCCRHAPKEVGEGSSVPTDPHHTSTTTQPSYIKTQKKQTRRNKKVLDLEEAKTAQAQEIASLKKRVKKLEKRRKSRTSGLKRLSKFGSARRVESSNNASLGAQEDASKQERKIADIDQDAEVTLIDETQGRSDDNLMFDTGVLDEQEVEVEKVVSTAEVEVTTSSATTTTVDELTLAQTLIEIKAAKPKAVTTAATTTTTTVTRPKARGVAKDKGKAKMVEPEKPLKKKDQIMFDQEIRILVYQTKVSTIVILDLSKVTYTLQGKESIKAWDQQVEIRIKQYFQIQDDALWEVIENGNSWVPIPITTPQEETGTSTTIKMTLLATIEEKTCKKNDVKAKSLLLMALPNEHQLTFDQYVDAQSMFAAIKARFGGNEATKKTQEALLKQQYENFSASSSESLDYIFIRLQKLVSRLEILGVVTPPEDLNIKNLRSLPSEWDTHVVVWMNKPNFDTMGLDDLYNNFKIVEQKVKKSAGASNDDKNLAFVTTSGASSTNNINTVNPEVSTATTKVNTASTEICTASFSDATVYAFLSTQPKGSQLVHEDLEQLHDDDLEEMDLKWNMALLSMRARKFYQRTGRKIIIDGSNTAGYDKSKVECFNCHKMGHFARECRAPRSKDNRNWNQGSSTKTVKIEDASEKAMCAIDGAGFDWSDMAEEEIQANMALMAFSDSEVKNDKSCSKNCLKNYEALKKQYDDLLVKLSDTGFKAATYKRGLATLEGQIVKYKEHEVLFSEEIALLKRSVGCKEYELGLLRTELEKVKQEKEGVDFKIAKFDKSAKDLNEMLESQITDKSKKGVGYNVVPSPHPLILNRPTPLDLSYSGLEEFKEPKVNEYGPRDSRLKPTIGCDKESDNSKENTDDSLEQHQMTDTETSSFESPLKVDKDWKEKFFYPANHESDNEDEVETSVVVKKKTVIPTSAKIEKPVRKPVKMSYPHPKGNFVPKAVLMKTGMRPVNTAKPKDAHNVVRTNQVNAVKDSAYDLEDPSKQGRKIDLINEDHFCLDGCTNSGEARVQQRKRIIHRKVQQKQKDQEDEVFGRILSAKKIKITAAGEKVNAAESLLVVSTEVNAN
ncbi:putative ribonuclease H-like domain-containing protein [Tanacetum coccineum]